MSGGVVGATSTGTIHISVTIPPRVEVVSTDKEEPRFESNFPLVVEKIIINKGKESESNVYIFWPE
jgi:hypothetical protein